MSFLWLESASNPHRAEYARAYDRAIRDGSIDSVISWELGGFTTKDGTLITEVPEEVKETLRNNPRYLTFIERVDITVRVLRESRDMATCQTRPRA